MRLGSTWRHTSSNAWDDPACVARAQRRISRRLHDRPTLQCPRHGPVQRCSKEAPAKLAARRRLPAEPSGLPVTNSVGPRIDQDVSPLPRPLATGRALTIAFLIEELTEPGGSERQCTEF